MNTKKTTTEKCVARRNISRSSSKHSFQCKLFESNFCIKIYKYAKSWFLFLPFQKSSVHVYTQNNSKFLFCRFCFALSQTEYPLKFLIALLISIKSCIFYHYYFIHFYFYLAWASIWPIVFNNMQTHRTKARCKLLLKFLFTSRPLILLLFVLYRCHLKLKSFIIMSMCIWMDQCCLCICVSKVYAYFKSDFQLVFGFINAYLICIDNLFVYLR